MKKLLLLFPLLFIAANEPINTDSLTGKVKATASNTGTAGKPFDFSAVNVTGFTAAAATNITATAPIVVTPSPITTGTGVISIAPGAFEVPLTFSQSLARAVNTVTLLNDSATPGNSKYYGTDSGGTKGFFNLPAGNPGTVTTFSAGDLSPLFTTTEVNPTTAPALSFALTNAAANSWFGNATGSSAAPAYNTSVFPAALMPALTGDVTTSAGAVATTIGSGKVTYAKMQNVSANSRLLGSGSAGTGLPPAEITVGSGLTMTGTTLSAAGGTTTTGTGFWHNTTGALDAASRAVDLSTADVTGNLDKTHLNSGTGATSSTFWRGDNTWAAPAGGGTVTNTGGNLTANSVVLGAGTTDTKVVGGVITDGTSKLTLGVSTTSVGSIDLKNLTSGTVSILPATGALGAATFTIPAGTTNPVVADTGAANNFLTAISSAGAISKARPAIASLSDAGTLATWAAVTPGTNVTTFLATPSSANLRGALTDENGTGAALFSGATTPDFTTGFTIGAAAASRKILVGNATNFVPSTETWAVPGASTNNVLKSDGTNWTAAQLAFSNLSGSATAAQMPAYTGDVTSSAGATVNTLVNIPATTTIGGVAGTRGDVLYYGVSGWAKLAAGTSGNQLTTNGAGADPTWAAPGSGGSGSPGGSNTQVQFNDSSAFGGDADFTWDKTNNILTLPLGTSDARFKIGSLEFNNYSLGNSWFGDNAYFDGATWKYRATGAASLFYFFAGYGQFRFFPSGTAGTAITNSGNSVFQMQNDGSVGIGGAITTATHAGSSLYLGTTASNQIHVASNFELGWSNTTGDASAAADTGFYRNAAGVVEVNNGTAGTYRTLKDDVTNAVTGFQVNGAAATGTHLRGNGTNFVPSTETYAAPGTASYQMVSDGTNWTSKAYELQNVDINPTSSPLTIGNADTYLPGSKITIAAGDVTVGTTYHAIVYIIKTAAGTNSGPLTLRLGTAGTTADTSIAVPMAAQTGTAVIDSGTMEVWATFTTIGASATVRYSINLIHGLTSTGLWNTGTSQIVIGTISQSATFSSTTGTKFGLSYNGGTSAAHTVYVQKAELFRP